MWRPWFCRLDLSSYISDQLIALFWKVEHTLKIQVEKLLETLVSS